MHKKNYDNFVSLLKKELVPALGCTEPIAIAYAAAEASALLGEEPEHLVAICSGNIIKNVMGVIVPNSGNNKGIEIAATLGAVAGNPDDGLEVLEKITPDEIERCVEIKKNGFCECRLAEGVDNLYIDIIVTGENHKAEVVIAENHTNIIKKVKDDKVIFDHGMDTKEMVSFIRYANIANIIDFADIVELKDVEDLLKMQIECNTAISKEGLEHDYGANVGKAILKNREDDLEARIKACVAAGSDARMSGCSLPVVINSGSGNQGMAVSLPIIEYAKYNNIPEEKVLRALVVSNLIALYVKKKIGSLSAFCGAVSAAAGAGAGIGYIKGFTHEQIGEVIEYTVANVGGLICDGAKSSCAAKLASAIDAMLLSITMVEEGYGFGQSEGLMGLTPDGTVKNVCYVGKYGMSETDLNILKIMTGEIKVED